MNKKMYKEPKIDVAVMAMRELMSPGGGSPINGDYDAQPNLAPKRVDPVRRTEVF